MTSAILEGSTGLAAATQKIQICALEYEKDMKDPMVGIAESVGYFNGVLDAKS